MPTKWLVNWRSIRYEYVVLNKRFLWVTDPWATLDHAADTTLRLVEEGVRHGLTNYWADFRTIRWEAGNATVEAYKVKEVTEGRNKESFLFFKAKTYQASYFSKFFYRTDPPVDLRYLQPLQLLALGTDPRKTEIVNNPLSLLVLNEKLSGSRLNLMAPTIAAASWNELKRFGCKHKLTVVKPMHEAQSKGISLLDWSEKQGQKKAKTVLAKVTNNWQIPVVLQIYLKSVKSTGETRLWFLDGNLLAVASKIPKKGHFIINMDEGAVLRYATLGSKDLSISKKIGKYLKEKNVRFAAIDLIDNKITDFNVTSPGLIVEMEQVTNQNLAQKIIKALIKI